MLCTSKLSLKLVGGTGTGKTILAMSTLSKGGKEITQEQTEQTFVILDELWKVHITQSPHENSLL